jgi:hypothetical protein
LKLAAFFNVYYGKTGLDNQAHTTSPSASASFVNAPPKRPPHPAPNISDDRHTPLAGRDDESCKFDLRRGQSEIFLAEGLDYPNETLFTSLAQARAVIPPTSLVL